MYLVLQELEESFTKGLAPTHSQCHQKRQEVTHRPSGKENFGILVKKRTSHCPQLVLAEELQCPPGTGLSAMSNVVSVKL